MAEGNDNCAICLYKPDDARALPCLHIFCLTCIEQLIKQSNDNKDKCPVCKNKFEIPKGGVKNLTPISRPKIVRKDVVEHDRQLSNSASDYSCQFNPDEKLQSYCEQCKLCICEQCFIHAHPGHTFSSLSMAIENIKYEILAKIDSLSSQAATAQAKLYNVKTMGKTSQGILTTNADTIAAEIDEMRLIVEDMTKDAASVNMLDFMHGVEDRLGDIGHELEELNNIAAP